MFELFWSKFENFSIWCSVIEFNAGLSAEQEFLLNYVWPSTAGHLLSNLWIWKQFYEYFSKIIHVT